MTNQIMGENNQYYPNADRNVKDRLFRFIFKEKKDLLDLYNAVNEAPCLECRAVMLNINYGHNKALMERCRKLEEYSIFIATVRKYKEIYGDLTQAVNMAIDECIKNNILREILVNSKSEVVSMVLTTFDREVYERDLKEDAYEDGMLTGALKTFIEMSQEHQLFTRKEALEEIMHKFFLDKEEAEKYMEEYWK